MDILETLCAERRADAARLERERPASSLRRLASAPRPSFSAYRRGGPRESEGLLVAECKRASPSRGLMVRDYDPAALARAYERGGAGMVSVLTEPRRFLGSDEDLARVREAVGLPILRKDFVVHRYQVLESWAIGADAILLIAAALGRAELLELAAAARELGLEVLVEVREAPEIEKAAAAKPDAMGVNARDLRDFSVDRSRAASLAALLPSGPILVAESGLRSGADAAALRGSLFRGFLVGEALATAADPEAKAREFVEAIGSID